MEKVIKPEFKKKKYADDDPVWSAPLTTECAEVEFNYGHGRRQPLKPDARERMEKRLAAWIIEVRDGVKICAPAHADGYDPSLRWPTKGTGVNGKVFT